MEAVATFGRDIGVKPACEALGLSRATYYRNKAGAGAGEKSPPAVPTSSRALSSEERTEVLDLMHSDRFNQSSDCHDSAEATLHSIGMLGCVSAHHADS